MQHKNRFALKEWAIILKALSEGRQILLLRKGGLIEKNTRFMVEHTEFFIYPTYLHQQRRGIVPAWRGYLEQILAAPPPEGEVILSHYAVVQQVLKIIDPDRIQTLSDCHVLNNEEVRKRFFYGQAPGLHLILLRVFQLPKPFRIPIRPHYTGCRSWVDLGQEIPTSGCRPVLNDDAFDREVRRITERIGPSVQPP
ncbi:MAG: DUF1802 family protein [Nitrospirae bacterium]|nr:DUF1802 family protein [Nitrospirota bacterium]